MGTQATVYFTRPKYVMYHGISARYFQLGINQVTVYAVRRFMEPSGDYRLTTYNAIRENVVLSDDLFVLKTNQHTKIVHPKSLMLQRLTSLRRRAVCDQCLESLD
jgi:hypothetical protein